MSKKSRFRWIYTSILANNIYPFKGEGKGDMFSYCQQVSWKDQNQQVLSVYAKLDVIELHCCAKTTKNMSLLHVPSLPQTHTVLQLETHTRAPNVCKMVPNKCTNYSCYSTWYICALFKKKKYIAGFHLFVRFVDNNKCFNALLCIKRAP